MTESHIEIITEMEEITKLLNSLIHRYNYLSDELIRRFPFLENDDIFKNIKIEVESKGKEKRI